LKLRAAVLLTLAALGGLVSPEAGCCAAVAQERVLRAEDVRRVASLDGEPQRTALREVLAGHPFTDEIPNAVFYYEARLRDPLRALLSDPKVGESAVRPLALIGVSEDLELIVQVGLPPRDGFFKNRWAYQVACALLEPGSEQEWAFLRKAALNEFEDRWVDAGAIQTLRLMASPRSQQILEEACTVNTYRAKSIARALEYINSNPPPLADENLEALAKRVAGTIKFGNWEGNGTPRYNQGKDKALIDSRHFNGEDRLTYTATFHLVSGVWRLRGLRETRQEYILEVTPVR
jgi:hypothetical protein